MNNLTVQSIIDQTILNKNNGHWHNKTHWPYQLEIKSWYDIGNAERFCYDNFRSGNWRNTTRYFGFKRKEDYEWFVLRWS